MLIGATWPWLSQTPAPAETWDALTALRPRAVRIAGNIGQDLDRLINDYPNLFYLVRAKLPLPHDLSAEQTPGLLYYSEWAGEPILYATLRKLLDAGLRVDCELANEPDLEWRPARSDHPECWAEDAADFCQYLGWQFGAFETSLGDVLRSGQLRMCAPALSEGWEERHAAWLDAYNAAGVWGYCGSVAVHAYVNGRAFDDPDWGGRPARYAEWLPGKPLEVSEINLNGQADAGTLASYLAGLADTVLTVDAACLFALPGQPDSPSWWAIDSDTMYAIRAALDPGVFA